MIKKLNTNPSYKTIGEVTKELGLVDKKTGHIQTHTIRYWETQFTQIKPSVRAGNRRYYSNKDFKLIKYVKYLLKEKGLTIKGVKNILNNPSKQSIDHSPSLGIYKHNLEMAKTIKNKVKNISKIIKELKQIK